jgi:hypothetical protein
MDDTLFKAILALDAYNRGYDAGIILSPNSEAPGIRIENAAILTRDGDPGKPWRASPAVCAGFLPGAL